MDARACAKRAIRNQTIVFAIKRWLHDYYRSDEFNGLSPRIHCAMELHHVTNSYTILLSSNIKKNRCRKKLARKHPIETGSFNFDHIANARSCALKRESKNVDAANNTQTNGENSIRFGFNRDFVHFLSPCTQSR